MILCAGPYDGKMSQASGIEQIAKSCSHPPSQVCWALLFWVSSRGPRKPVLLTWLVTQRFAGLAARPNQVFSSASHVNQVSPPLSREVVGELDGDDEAVSMSQH